MQDVLCDRDAWMHIGEWYCLSKRNPTLAQNIFRSGTWGVRAGEDNSLDNPVL